MTFETRNGQKGKRVLSDAHHTGHTAGDHFEVRLGLEAAEG